jgi:hypothetical protein
VKVFTEKFLPIGAPKEFVDLFEVLYKFQCSMCRASAASCGPSMYGAAEMRVYVRGEELIGAIKLPHADGTDISFADFTRELDSLDGVHLAALLKSDRGFM